MGPQEDTTGVCVNYRGTTEMHGSPEKTPAVNSSVNKKKKEPNRHNTVCTVHFATEPAGRTNAVASATCGGTSCVEQILSVLVSTPGRQ